MNKNLFLMVLLTSWPTFSLACLGPSLHQYYFFAELQNEFDGADFIALAKVLEFRPVEYQETTHTRSNGEAYTSRKLVSAPRVTLEILEVLKGETETKFLTQELQVTSCSYWFADDRSNSEFFVAGQIVDGVPLINEYRRDDGGLY